MFLPPRYGGESQSLRRPRPIESFIVVLVRDRCLGGLGVSRIAISWALESVIMILARAAVAAALFFLVRRGGVSFRTVYLETDMSVDKSSFSLKYQKTFFLFSQYKP